MQIVLNNRKKKVKQIRKKKLRQIENHIKITDTYQAISIFTLDVNSKQPNQTEDVFQIG